VSVGEGGDDFEEEDVGITVYKARIFPIAVWTKTNAGE
jgi:hypothetical protein